MKITSHTKPMSKPLSDFIAIIVALSLVFLQVPLLKFAQVARADSDSDAVATQAESVDVGVSFDHAYIEYSGQVVAPPAKKITLPAGADLVFTAEPDSGYEISEVIADLGGSEVELAPNSKGQYKIGSGSLAEGAFISVYAVAIPEPVVEPEPEPEPEPVVEEAVVEEPQDEAASQGAPAADAQEPEGSDASSSAAAADGKSEASASAAAADDEAKAVEGDEKAEGTEGDKSEGAEDASSASAAKVVAEPNTQSEFVYEDNQVIVKATVTDPAALPAGVKFVVTPVTPRSTAYNYDAYIDALDKSTDKEITSDNTLLYDVAFMLGDEEVELAQGTVHVDFQFKNNQLTDKLNAEAASDIEVVHLPLTDKAKSGVDSTAEATNISASDVKVETVNAVTTVEGSTQKTEFTTDGFSIYALTAGTVAQGTTPEGDNTVTVSFENTGGSSAAGPSGEYYLLVGFERGGNVYYVTSDKLDTTKTSTLAVNQFVQAYWHEGTATPTSSDTVVARVVTTMGDEWQPSNIIKGQDANGVASYKDGDTLEGSWTVSIQLPDSMKKTETPVETGLQTQAGGGAEPANVTLYRDVLGDAVNFGIVTGYFNLPGGDAETNIAALKGKCVNQTGNDLTNAVEQTFILAEVDGEFGVKGFNAYVLTTEADADKVKAKGAHVVIDTSKSKTELQTMVNNMLSYTANQSTTLKGHAANAEVQYNGGKYVLDLRGKDSGVYYVSVDANTFSQMMSEAAKFQIYKSDTQTVVFNVSGNVSQLHKFEVNNQGSDSFLGSNAGITTETLIWNFPDATNINIVGSFTGVVLAPNATVDVNTTSSGWLMCANVNIGSGEWHSVYQKVRELREGSEATLRSTKLVDNEDATVSGFTFKLERKNGDTWEQVSTTTNTNADIAFDALPFNENNFTETGNSQYYIYRISEARGDVAIDGVTYHPDTAVYYAKITVKKVVEVTSNTRTTIYSADTPEYYTDEACTQPVNGLPAFNNTSEEIPDNITVSGTKTWSDGENRDGKRPSSITVNLLANGTKVKEATVTPDAEGNWTYSFTDLPRKQGDTDITYTVTENAVSGYTTTISGYNITNSYIPETTSVSGNKTWTDGDNRDGKRPASITVNLLANGVEVQEKTVTPDAQGNWSYSFTDLPKNENGRAIAYTVTEDPVSEYTTVVSGYNIINSYTPETTGVSVEKVWNDNNNQDGKRADSVEVALYGNGQPVVVNGQALKATLSATNNWSASWTDLPKNASGQAIDYTVQETSVPTGYTVGVTYGDSTTVQGGKHAVVTNTHTPETTSVSGSKSWQDNGNADGNRPDYIEVKLMDGTTVVDTTTVRVSENGEWNYTFENLPVYDNGRKINYTVTETPIGEYQLTVDGTSMVNSYKPTYTNLKVKKAWEDANDQDGQRPADVTVQLLRNGEAYGQPVKVTAVAGWVYEWKNLPAMYNGEPAVYTVDEVAVSGYSSDDPVKTGENEYTITNRRTPDKTSITATKKWEDSNNRDNVRPTSVQLQLYKEVGGNKTAVDDPVTVTANAAGVWTYTWTGLDKYASGQEIVYSVDETVVPTGYEKEVSGNATDGFIVTNSHENEKVPVSVKKVWSDSNNQDGKRPSEVTVTLKADGASIDAATLSDEYGWEKTWTDLPKYRTGKVGEAIVYTVEESTVSGYTLSTETVDGVITLTNTHIPEKVNIGGSKTWSDNNNQDGIRPNQITVNLLANGTKIDSVTTNAKSGWAYSFTELPKYANGEVIEYTIEEEAVTGYTPTVSGYNIDNRHIPETVEINGSKVWNDNDNQDGKRPESITVRLLADGVEKASQTVTPDASGNWSYSFTGLPKYKDGGTLIEYTVSEDEVANYTTVIEGRTITNTHIPETVEVNGAKTWDDSNNQDGKRPEYITVILKANGVEKQSIKVTSENNWSYSFTNLPKYENGEVIVYSIDEEAVENYTKAVSGYNLINSYETEETSVSGSKTWEDVQDQDGRRPESIWVILKADGVEKQRVEAKSENNWAYSFTNLPKYKDGGTLIEYTVDEEAVEGYTKVVSGNNITNMYIPETTYIQGTKIWDDAENQDGVRPDEVTVRLFADGDEVDHLVVHKADDGTWPVFTFSNLPVYKAGEKITYTISEDPVAEYSKTIGELTKDGNGYAVSITNSHTPKTTSVEGKKTWSDADNQDGLRPTSITVNLLANGEKVDSKTVTATDDWKYSFTDLPMYKGGVLINYTVTEDAVTEYTTEINGFDIVNTHQPKKTQISVKKVWDDADSNGKENFDGLRPATITVELYAGQTKIDEATLSEATNWSASWSNLDKYANGAEIVYTVKEVQEGSLKDYYTTSAPVLNDEGVFVITNKHTVEKVKVSGTKVWSDANDQDGKRPDSVTVNLLADGEQIDSAIVTASDNWTFEFTELPKYADGKVIEYTVSEEAVEGYTGVITGSAAAGFKIENTYKPKETEVSVTKIWDDADNQDGIRPTELTVFLMNGTIVVDSVVLNEENEWTHTWTGLDKYAGGQEIDYTVQEDPDNPVANYSAKLSGSRTTGFFLKNTHKAEEVDVSVVKAWNDANNQDGIRPTSIEVELKATVDGVAIKIPDVVMQATLNAGNGFSWSWEGLPKMHNGKTIVYTLDETNVPTGYTKTVSSVDTAAAAGVNAKIDFTVTNTHTPEVVSIPASKKWDDANNQDGFRPASIDVALTVNGNTVTIDGQPATATLNADNSWSVLWENLPKYEAGVLIPYKVIETAVVGGYQKTSDGTAANDYQVTNKHETEKTNISVVKTWNDANNQDGKRTAYVTVELYANGTYYDSATLNSSNNWSASWENLDKYANGAEIDYTLVETEASVPADYTADVSRTVSDHAVAFTVTNTHEPEKVTVSGTKTWDDATNQDGKRPQKIVVKLMNGNEVVKTANVEADAEGNWSYSFVDLPKYAAGEIINYTVAEETVAEYTFTRSGSIEGGFDLKNSYKPGEVDISVKKAWDDADNQDGVRPASVKVQLYADGATSGDAVTLNEGNSWSYTWEDLPEKAAGMPISYTVKEVEDDSWSGKYTTVVTGSAAAGYTVTNKHTPEETTAYVKKAWDDADNQDGKRPASISVQLLANGEAYHGAVTLSKDNSWEYTWEGLPKYANGNEIEYTLAEISNPEGYTVAYATEKAESGYSFTVTNTHAPEYIDIPVSKVWNDSNNQDGLRPASITANLKVGNDIVSTVVLNADNNWSAKFENLPKYAGGELIAYEVEEVTVPDYSTEITGSVAAGFVITNDHTTINTEIEATKVWDDADNQDGKRPASVTVQLRDGNGPVGNAVELNAGNNWHYKWKNLPKYAGGEEIQYSVVETVVPDEYTSEVTGSAADGFTVTNSYKPGVTNITVTKAWDDADNQDGIRPESINVQLQVDGVAAQIDGVDADVVLNADNSWTYTWSNLDKMKAGAVINYSVVETSAPEGYSIAVNPTGEGAYTATNSHTPELTKVTVSKEWNDDNNRDGLRPTSVNVTLFANGEEKATATVTPDTNGNWSYTFDQLPKFANGEEIKYTVQEAPVTGYTAETNGFAITNGHDNEQVEISGTKTWNDAANKDDGIRPASIKVNLLADGTKVKDATVEPDENGNWSYSFTELDKFRDGGIPIVYTVTEEAVPGYTSEVSGYNLTNAPKVGNLVVSKTVENATPNTESVKFAFTVTLDNENVTGPHGDMSFENGVAHFELAGGESAEATDLPEGVGYTVEEESLDAYTTTQTGDTGKIVANETAQAAFVNTYQATGKVRFFVEKQLKGRTLHAEEFSFTLTDETNGTTETVQNGGDGFAQFSEITYTLDDLNKTFKYRISEDPGDVPAVTYATNVYEITVTLYDKGNGELGVNYTGYDPEKGAVFENIYTPRGTLSLSTMKTIDGDKLPEAEAFTFVLKDADGNVVKTAKNDAQGNVKFEDFEVTSAKTREYTISEVIDGDAVQFNRGWVFNNIIYDEGTSKIVVKATDNFDGTLKLEPVYDGGTAKVFDNKTAPKAEFELKAYKHMTGRSLNANDNYTFTVTGSEGAPMPTPTSVTLTPTQANDEEVSFGNIVFTTNDLNKTYTYTITESGGQADSGVTNDPFPHTVTVKITDGLDGTLKVTPTYENASGKIIFNNTYEAEGSIVLTAKKTLDGRDLKGSEFFFTATGDKIQGQLDASETADGTVEFAPIRITQDDLENGAADFHYTIKEVKGTLGGITYDETSYDVTAHVEDNGSGQLVVTYDYGNAAEPPTFKNSYKPEPVSVDLEAYKTLAGGTIADHEFEFTLTETTEGAMNPVSQTKKCDANGVVKFDKITYEPSETNTYPKTYTYTVSENIPQGATNNNDGTFTGRDGITYDGSTHTVTVVVTDDGYGKLLAEVTYDDGQPGISFNNVELVRTGFEFNKYYYGGMGTFNFTMIATDAQRNPRGANPADYSKEKTIVDNGTEAFKATVQNEDFDSGVWKVRFPELSYAADGDYYYLIYEDEASTQDVVVDEAQYFAHVVVSGGQIASTTFNLIYHDVDYNTTSDLSFYNNSGITLGFNSLTTQSTLEDQRVSVYPKAMKYLNGSTAQLVGGDFEFQLIDEQTGELLAAATNDETGNIAFFDENTDPGLVYDKPGTYRYLIREVPGDVTGMIYDNSAILLTVEVTQGEEGLEATTTYNGPAGAEPAFFNLQEGMDLTVQKVSRYGGEGLVDCTYALWMVGESGDVMIAEATSDATGYITFKNVNLMKGQKYYFKEVEAPFGHTVDPYRTAYFALNETGDALVLVEETAADGWHSATENIEVDKAKASEAN